MFNSKNLFYKISISAFLFISIIIGGTTLHTKSQRQIYSYEYQDIEDILLNSNNPTKSSNEGVSALEEVLMHNQASCFFDTVVYSDKLHNNFNSYRLFHYLFIQKDIFNLENNLLNLDLSEVELYINSDKLEINFSNILYALNTITLLDGNIALENKTSLLFDEYIQSHFNSKSQLFFNNDSNEDLRQQIFATNQALRIFQEMKLQELSPNNDFESAIAYTTKLVEDPLFEKDLLLLVTLVHNLYLYDSLDPNYTLSDNVIDSYLKNVVSETEASFLDSFKTDDMYSLEVILTLLRMDKLQSLNINEPVRKELSIFNEQNWKNLISQNIGLAYTKLNILKELNIYAPSSINEITSNYKILVYENIPILNLEEQYYGALLMKYFNIDLNGFDQDNFIKACFNSLSNGTNIKNIYYAFKIYTLLDIDNPIYIENLKQLYQDSTIIVADNNYESMYYIAVLNENLFENENFILPNHIRIFDYAKALNTPNKLMAESNLYYLVKYMIEMRIPINFKNISNLAEDFFVTRGYSLNNSEENTNIYSTYRMIELFKNNSINVDTNSLENIKLYSQSLKHDLGFYLPTETSSTIGTSVDFTLKSWCFGLALNTILKQ